MKCRLLVVAWRRFRLKPRCPDCGAPTVTRWEGFIGRALVERCTQCDWHDWWE